VKAKVGKAFVNAKVSFPTIAPEVAAAYLAINKL